MRGALSLSSFLLASCRASPASFAITSRGMSSGFTHPLNMRAVVAVEGVAVVAERPLPVLRSGEVLVKVHYSAINRADTLQRKGLYPPPPGESDVLGLELAGVVVDTGDLPIAAAPAIGSRVMVSRCSLVEAKLWDMTARISSFRPWLPVGAMRSIVQ